MTVPANFISVFRLRIISRFIKSARQFPGFDATVTTQLLIVMHSTQFADFQNYILIKKNPPKIQIMPNVGLTERLCVKINGKFHFCLYFFVFLDCREWKTTKGRFVNYSKHAIAQTSKFFFRIPWECRFTCASNKQIFTFFSLII